MKVFVTGGTGFIGSHLIEFLIKKGFEVFALIRDIKNPKWLKGLNIHFLRGDLLSIPSLPVDLDYVFHAAGLTKAFQLAEYYTVNQHGTASILQALYSQKIYPKKIIYLSSLAAVGPTADGHPIQESDLPHPLTPYGKSKLMGEIEALKFRDLYPVVILRIAAAFGPRDKDFLGYFKLVKRGILGSLGSEERIVSMCYIKDLVEALYLCAQKEIMSGEIFNIADPHPYIWDDIGRATGQALGKKLIKVNVPIPLVYLGAVFSELGNRITRRPAVMNRHKFREISQKCWIADTRKAKAQLSFQTHSSLQDAIQETIDWYLENNWL